MKKYFKKLTAILVVLVMLLASVPASAQTTKELFQRSEAQSGPDQKQLLKACQYLQKEMLKAEDKKYKILCNVSFFHDLVI